VLVSGQGFRKDVRGVLVGRNIIDSNVPVFDSIAHKMVTDVEMFGPRVMNGVLDGGEGTL